MLSIAFVDWQTQGKLEAGMYPSNYGINGITVVNMYTERVENENTLVLFLYRPRVDSQLLNQNQVEYGKNMEYIS